MADSTPWVDGLTIGAVLRQTATRYELQDALVYPQLGLRLSWKQFDAAVDEAAKGLLHLGIRKGEHVAVWATNLPQWVILQCATARIGVVLVTVNPAYRSHELSYTLQQSECVALFITDQFKSSNYYEIFAETCPEVHALKAGRISAAIAPKLRYVVALKEEPPIPGMISWKQMLEMGRNIPDEELAKAEAAPRAEDPINIQYTSGTTGYPKAAMLTHRNILLNGFYVTGCQNITADDRMCIPVPYYHCFGCVMGNLGAITRGAAMVIPAEYFDPAATLDAIEKERCTTLYGVPTMFIAQLEHPSFKGRNLSSLRSGIMAGSPCPTEVMKRVIEHMGISQITIAYGQTETAPVLTQTRVDDPLELRVESVGKALPGVTVKILDPATEEECAVGEKGELCAQTHGMMLGYYKDPDATARAIRQGWIHTGDLAYQREDGYFRICGRLKDMVIRGGENIYPLEIEELLYTHPAVEQVAITGVPDPKYGEELCAWVKIHQDHPASEEDIRAYCKQKLAHYKVPRYVKFVESFPQTVSGKIQKFKIREQMIEELGLEEQRTA